MLLLLVCNDDTSRPAQDVFTISVVVLSGTFSTLQWQTCFGASKRLPCAIDYALQHLCVEAHIDVGCSRADSVAQLNVHRRKKKIIITKNKKRKKQILIPTPIAITICVPKNALRSIL